MLNTRREKEGLQARIHALEEERRKLARQVKSLRREAEVVREEEGRKREEEVGKYRVELKKLKARNELIQEGLENFLLKSQNEVTKSVLGGGGRETHQ